MREIMFVVVEDPAGGFTACAASEPIFTQAETIAQLHERVRDAVRCHFGDGELPRLIRLRFVREEMIAT